MICLVVAEKDPEGIVNTIKEYPNPVLYEIRLDYLENTIDNPANLIFFIKRHTQKPLIITNRSKDEGGNSCLSERERISLLIKALDGRPDIIDIELSAENSYRNELISLAKSRDVKVIISYHNFYLTPDFTELIDIIKKAKELKADIIKIATFARNKDDILKVLRLYEHIDTEGQRLLAFNMGKLGKITRVISLYLGAPFMYVSKECNTRPAPGQFTIGEFTTLLSILEEK